MTVAEAGPIGLLAVGIAAAMGAIIGLKAKIVRYRGRLAPEPSGQYGQLWLPNILSANEYWPCSKRVSYCGTGIIMPRLRNASTMAWLLSPVACT